jgi:CelD/BcsL family acetyltransferase involved in cellulose biosynthesis
MDWIIHRDGEEETHYAVADTLRKHRDKWDCIWMPYVRKWTGSHNLIIEACGKVGFRVHTRPVDYAYVSLPESMDSFESSLSRNMRQQLKRQQKKILGRKKLVVKQCQDSRDLELYLEALFDLNCRRWGKLGQIGTFRKKPSEALFYQKFCRTALEKNWLRLFALTENGEFKGVQVGYAYNSVFYQMQEGFDPDYIAGVGNVLRSKVIEACIEEGLKGYDFLGEMTKHKTRWLASRNCGIDILIGRSSLRNTIIFRNQIWLTGKYFKPSILASRQPNAARSNF